MTYRNRRPFFRPWVHWTVAAFVILAGILLVLRIA
jgi:negative regulator of sigma E activity